MGEPFIAGVVGFLGIIVGALLQHWFNRRLFQEARYLELKSKAYADFVDTVATAAFVTKAERSKTLEKLVSAKGRICVFGDKEVIEAIVRLEGTSLVLSNEDAKHAFMNLLQIVRSNGIAKGSVSDSDLDIALFGSGDHTRSQNP